jgi:hypothetical protein
MISSLIDFMKYIENEMVNLRYCIDIILLIYAISLIKTLK